MKLEIGEVGGNCTLKHPSVSLASGVQSLHKEKHKSFRVHCAHKIKANQSLGKSPVIQGGESWDTFLSWFLIGKNTATLTEFSRKSYRDEFSWGSIYLSYGKQNKKHMIALFSVGSSSKENKTEKRHFLAHFVIRICNLDN